MITIILLRNHLTASLSLANEKSELIDHLSKKRESGDLVIEDTHFSAQKKYYFKHNPNVYVLSDGSEKDLDKIKTRNEDYIEELCAHIKSLDINGHLIVAMVNNLMSMTASIFSLMNNMGFSSTVKHLIREELKNQLDCL